MAKPFIYLSIMLSLAAAYSTIMWQMSRVEVERLESHAAALEDAVERSNRTVKGLMAFNERMATDMKEFAIREAEIRDKTQRITNDLNQLRLSEAQSALAAPFDRGNAARARREHSIMRFMAKTNRGAGDSRDSEAGDSG